MSTNEVQIDSTSLISSHENDSSCKKKEFFHLSKRRLKKQKKSEFESIQIFWGAPIEAFFNQEIVASVRGVSVSTLENERWRGMGIPYRKISGRVLYRKNDVVFFLESHELINSTSEYK